MPIKDVYNRIIEYTGGWSKNVGRKDARIRVIFGTLLVLLAPLQASGYVPIPVFSSVGATLAGIILVIEGLVNRCVLYSLLGINRCPADLKEQD